MARQEQPVRQVPERTERRVKVEGVAHERHIRVYLFEEVVVVEAPERPAHHRVAEVPRPVVTRRPAGEVLPHPEVPRAPSHFVA